MGSTMHNKSFTFTNVKYNYKKSELDIDKNEHHKVPGLEVC